MKLCISPESEREMYWVVEIIKRSMDKSKKFKNLNSTQQVKIQTRCITRSSTKENQNRLG